MLARPDARGPVLLFDGVCNLCNASVQFVIDRDPEARFRFAALQSEVGRELAEGCGIDADALASLVLVEDGRCYTRSSAALRVARGLKKPWPLVAAFTVVPRPLRDVVYDFIAERRYRWFGKEEACRIPTPELRARFLDA
jgi:predicted DCC family thiol-disulfide oxidoreductase YuxK